ncbi:uncharacterized protein LOC143526922 isoform X2 [Brachyhypopomus gauderio]|uniref:uncharacterized protein LOC143526922 isoform X2 n=1 Tax=Brachyhypopomus gauderio TaxID=698409 RepID=UPI0040433D65
MSWAADDWTSGLSGRALQKVQELQARAEKLERERQQRQLQLDNSDAALHKQKQKYEEVRVELAGVQRELAGVREEAQGEARARERLAQELQTKVAQVCGLEGQLDSARALAQNLTQEVKRLEAELEKLQKGSVSGDSMLFSTPSWSMNSPWDQSDGKSVPGGAGDATAHCSRQRLVFGESPRPPVGGVSSESAQQPHKTPPLRRRVHQSDARPFSSVFPWERDDTRSTPRGRPVSTPCSSISSNDVVISISDSRDNGAEEALRKERDEASARVCALQRDLQLERERLREAEARVAQTQRDISTKERNHSRTADELARAHTRIAQEGDRAQAAEQRVKQLQEELKCQRQNAETSRCNAEQCRRDTEREHQRELQEVQRERHTLQKQHQQDSNRLNQEIQQARTLHNTLQAQCDKLALQKQAVERDLEGTQAKLKNMEADLTESQKREAQTLGKLTEALKDSEGLRLSLEQLKKREKTLEADVKRLAEELAEALKLIRELQAQLENSPQVSAPFTPVAVDSFSPALSGHQDHTSPRQPSSQRNRALRAERVRQADRPGVLTYPPDREPGEGIDSEHISVYSSENTLKTSVKQAGSQHEAGSPGVVDMDSSMTEQDTGIEDTDTESNMSDSTSDAFPLKDIHRYSESENPNPLDQEKKEDSPLVELKKENTALRDELWDVKRELEQRLEDLETQRRAEAEARTKLKQLSKKHSTQAEQHRAKALELKEQGAKLETQLDVERRESARLREAVTALEERAEKRRQDGEREEDARRGEDALLRESLAETERKVAEHEGERERMQKELEALQSELLQERQERRREREEEKMRLKSCEREELKIAELQAELDRLQRSAGPEDKSVIDMPLAYLQLGNQSNTTDDIAVFENEVISPLSFCEAANLQNVMFSKEMETTALITEDQTRTQSQQNTEDNTTAEELGGQAKTKDVMDVDNTTILVLEVERLRTQKDREAERAKNTQKKLETLQHQVTRQTQQLTLAFQNQSKHIEDLLRELQERDDALRRQEVELHNCLEEIALLKSDKQKEMASGIPLNTEHSLEASGIPLNTEHSLEASGTPLNTEHSLEASGTPLNTEHSLEAAEIPLNTEHSLEASGIPINTEHSLEASGIPINTEHSLEVVEDPHCELEISSATPTTETVGEAASPFIEDEPLHSDPLQPCSTEDGSNGQPSSFSSTSGDPYMSNAPLGTGVHTSLPTLDAHDKDSAFFTESTVAKEPLEEQTTTKQGSHCTVHKNSSEVQAVPGSKETDGPCDAPEVLQGLLGVSTVDISVLKRVINELHEAQSELTLWKAKHDQLTVQLEDVSRQDLLSIKQENDQLKLKLLDNEKCLARTSPLGQQESFNLTNTQERHQATKDCCAGASCGLEETVETDGPSGDGLKNVREDGGKENGVCEKETPSSPEVDTLQEQLRVLQTQHQLLCEQNSQQAEELQLWRLSALPLPSLGRHGDGQPIVLVREDAVVLPCVHGGRSRAMEQQGGLTQESACCGPETGDQTGYQLPVRPTADAQVLVVKNNGTIKASEEVKMEMRGTDVNTSLSSRPVSSSELGISDGRPDLAHRVKQTGPREDVQQAVSFSCDDQLRENAFRTESQEDSATAETQTKVICPQLNTEASSKKHSQKPSIKHDDTFTSLQHGEALVSTTDYQNKHAAANGRQTDKPLQRGAEPTLMCPPVVESQSSQVTNITESPSQNVTREVKSVPTQTHLRRAEEELLPSRPAGRGPLLVHASTQTCADEPKHRDEEEEEQDAAAGSSPLPLAPPPDTEKLLFSGSFPIPADPAHLAERIRRGRSRMSVAYDDTEYEPYGLPEVVMKGFADIPMGPACPYVLRRGLLGTNSLPLPLRKPPPVKEAEEEVDP